MRQKDGVDMCMGSTEGGRDLGKAKEEEKQEDRGLLRMSRDSGA